MEEKIIPSIPQIIPAINIPDKDNTKPVIDLPEKPFSVWVWIGSSVFWTSFSSFTSTSFAFS